MFDPNGDLRLGTFRFPALATFVFFESGLGLLGLLLLRMYPPAEKPISTDSLSLGLAYSVPLLGLAIFATSQTGMSWAPLKKISDVLMESFLGRFIARSGVPSFFLVSLAAGWGEELLFRAWLQPWVGIWIASLIFGIFHSLTAFYFLLATVIGLYLGWVFQAAGFWPCVVAHTLYDFVALVRYKKKIKTAASHSELSAPVE